jgi:DNA-binding NarL/FixJ family response regulator
MTGLMIADDHQMVRQVLRNCFREAGLQVVAEADSADDAVEQARRSRPEIAILDVSMPGDFFGAIEAIKSMEPPPKILVLTALKDDALSVRCMRAGADGFICKTEPVQQLLEAIHRLQSGGKYLSAELACRMATSRPEDAINHEGLSRRELQVLKLLGKAQTVTGIAKDLGLSFKTISTYRTRILEKMGFESNTDIIRYCMEHSLS